MMDISSQSIYVSPTLEMEIYPKGLIYDLRSLAEPLSFIRAKLAEIEGRADGEEMLPYRVFGDVTNNCNLRCPFCMNGESWSSASSARMTSAAMQAYCGLAPLLYEGSPLHLSCRMEPFLHPGFLDLIEQMPDQVRSRSMFTTNLTIRRFAGLATRLLESGIGFFNVSIDSLEQRLFEELRKFGKYSFYKENLEVLSAEVRRRQYRRLRVITVAVRQNAAEIPDLMRRVREMFPFIEHEVRRPFGPYSYISPSERDWAQHSFMDDEEWQELVARIDHAALGYTGYEESPIHRTFFNDRITTPGYP